MDSARLPAVLTEDITIVAGALSGIPLVASTPVVAACLVYLGWLSPVILVSGAIAAGSAVAAYVTMAALAASHLRESRAGQDALVRHFGTLIGGFRELKLHRGRRDALFSRGLEPAALRVRDQSSAGLTLFAMAEGLSEFAFFGFLGFLLFVLPAFRPVDRGTLAGAVLVVLYVMAPLDVLVTWIPLLGRARVSLHRIEALVPTLQAEEESPRGEPPGRIDSVRLEGVTYAYRPESEGHGFALGPVDLTVEAGEILFLVGGNGSGKTTLAKLLSGLYQPDSGTLFLDDRSIDGNSRAEYRELFSVLFAEGHLFPDLHGLGRPGLEDEARELLEGLGLNGRVRVEEGRFSTTDLSMGQRGRLALLGRLARRPARLRVRRVGRESGPAFQEDVLPRAAPQPSRVGEGGRGDHARRGLFRRRRSGPPIERGAGRRGSGDGGGGCDPVSEPAANNMEFST